MNREFQQKEKACKRAVTSCSMTTSENGHTTVTWTIKDVDPAFERAILRRVTCTNDCSSRKDFGRKSSQENEKIFLVGDPMDGGAAGFMDFFS